MSAESNFIPETVAVKTLKGIVITIIFNKINYLVCTLMKLMKTVKFTVIIISYRHV